ncbi:MAG: quinol:cytochrome C oxidoreductase, partial [Fulvivirga sp.]|nr:quinol:cytochrome C oxidoreductase [Fulvivirga sp.]
MTEERFSFTSQAKKTLFIIGIVGLLLIVLGALTTGDGHGGGHGEEGHALNTITENSMLADANGDSEGSAAVKEEGQGEGEHHGSAPWLKRFYSN